MKTICANEISRNYADAGTFCRSKGMQVFRSDSSTQAPLLGYLQTVYGTSTSKRLWLNDGVTACPAATNAGGPFVIAAQPCTDLIFTVCEFV